MFHVKQAWNVASAILAAGICAGAPAGTRARIAADFSPFATATETSAAPLTETNLSAKATRYAAEELRTYLCRLSGVPPSDPGCYPIVSAGSSQPARFHLVRLDDPRQRRSIRGLIERAGVAGKLSGQGSFALVPSQGRLYFIAPDSTGLLYAVYHFLELQGVRWYAPGPEGEFVPPPHPLQEPASVVVERPRFLTRGFWAWEPRGNRDFHVWMARNRFNFWTVADRDGLFLRMLGFHLNAGGHWFFERYLNPEDEYPYQVSGFPGRGKPPDPYPQDPHEFRGDANHDGKLTYFEAHPEWYGLIGGERRTFKGATGVNVCSSNPYVMAELCKRIVRELSEGEWKNAAILDFWALDVGKWCECDRCRALGTPTDRLLRMVHQVRTALTEAEQRKVLPRPVVVFFPIYAETLAPPTRPLPAQFDYERTIGTLFPIHRCYRHGLDDPDCRETNVPIWNTILGWQSAERFYRGGFVMGEYYNVSTTKSLPVLYTRVMAHDIPLYYTRGVRHFHYMHVSTSLPGFKRLTNYLLGKLLWNPQVDTQALAEQYFRDFYGEAGGAMRELYGRLEEAMSSIHQWKSDRQRLTDRINRDLDPLFSLRHLQLSSWASGPVDRGVPLERSAEELKACRAILDRVLEQGQPLVIRQRLLEDDRNLRYAEDTVNLYYWTARAILARRAGDLEAARRFFAQTPRIVQALRAETAIVQSSASHANAADGFAASLIEPGWKRLSAELGISAQ